MGGDAGGGARHGGWHAVSCGEGFDRGACRMHCSAAAAAAAAAATIAAVPDKRTCCRLAGRNDFVGETATRQGRRPRGCFCPNCGQLNHKMGAPAGDLLCSVQLA